MALSTGIELQGHDILDESAIPRFHHLVEQHKLTEQMFDQIRSLLVNRRLLRESGTVVDATTIFPPRQSTSTRRVTPEIRRSSKGNDSHWSTTHALTRFTGGSLRRAAGSVAELAVAGCC
jgi:transposase, IS5 family